MRGCPAQLCRFEGLKAVVAGATGGVGKAIVQRLVREGVPVTALARDVRDAVRPPPCSSPSKSSARQARPRRIRMDTPAARHA